MSAGTAPGRRTGRPGHWVLGLSASHNGGACLVHDGRIVVAVQEERLSGVKRDRVHGATPSLATSYCLQTAGIDVHELDLVVLCAQGPAQDPAQDLALNPQLRLVANGVPWCVISHHLGHALSAYATSGLSEAAILVIDGLGSPFEDLSAEEQLVCCPRTDDGWETLSVYDARGITVVPLLKRMLPGGRWLERTGAGMPRFSGLGGMYSAVAEQIFGDPMQAGKVMGLAALGTPVLEPGAFFSGEGSQLRFLTGVPERMLHTQRWPAHGEEYADLAASVQRALETALRGIAAEVRTLSSAADLCYAGGVALNCPVNEMLCQQSGFGSVYVPPPAEDSGPAIGAAFHGLWKLSREHTRTVLRRDGLGRTYSTGDVGDAVAAVPGTVIDPADSRRVIEAVAGRLAEGQIGAWFDGGSELGPRALGSRSLLADPRSAQMKEHINGQVKKRESFRPLAPAVLAEQAHEWFEIDDARSPFMLRAWRFRGDKAALVPAVVHSDGTGRAQTVDLRDNPRLHRLITAFHRRTGVPMLLNTSLNGRAEPIAETPQDALWCMLDLGLDFVAFENCVVELAPDAPSVLDLVPVLDCAAYTVRLRPRQALSPDGEERGQVTITVRSAWGERQTVVPAHLTGVLTLVDGSCTVRDLARKLPPVQHPGDWSVLDAVRVLRRCGAVKLTKP